jgi:hypothetical protein
MVKIELDNMKFEWDSSNELEFEQIKECLEILKTMGLEIERIKSADKRLEEMYKMELKKHYNDKK